MSPDVLQAVNDEAAAEAAKKNRVPYVPHDDAEAERWPPFPFPNLGSYIPPGWELTKDTFFVDKTGFGSGHERAFTGEQFKQLIIDHIANNPRAGYAIIEEGPFQLVVGAMRRVREEIRTTLESK